jgi:hypothetical protein
MFLSVSAVLLFGVAVWMLIRYAGLRSWQALVCALFGFFLASSRFAPNISNACTAVAHYIAGIQV